MKKLANNVINLLENPWIQMRLEMEDYFKRGKLSKCKKCKKEAIMGELCCSHFLKEHRRLQKEAAKSQLMVG